MWLEIFLWFIVSSYALFTLLLWRIWKSMPLQRADANEILPADRIWVSVIIPVRNEAENIGKLLKDLENQTLSYPLFEVWVVDDASTDATTAEVTSFAKHSALNLHLLPLENNAVSSPKKRAIQAAIKVAKGQLVVTTDGDCRVGENWLVEIVTFYQKTGARCISGPVTFTEEDNLTDYLQTVEFASLIGSGACAMDIGQPNMCNGANFAYEKKVFEEVGGFEGVDQIASGDDELLMHKIHAAYPGTVKFLKAQGAVVQTLPHKKWEEFRNQRQRWASKWRYYRTFSPKVLAVYIFICNSTLILGGLTMLFGYLSGYVFSAVFLLKILPEWLFVGSVLRFLRKARAIYYLPLVQILYPFYVLYFGLAGQKAVYEWKGRQLK